MNKVLRRGRLIIALCIGVLSVLAFSGLFYPIKIFDIQLTALLQKLLVDFSWTAAILFLALIAMTLLFGRIYCSTLCPFGLLQEFLLMIFRRRVSVQNNKPYKYFLAAVVFGTLIGGTALIIRLIDPYTLFGSAAGMAWLGLGAVAIIIVLTWFKGRIFCSNICPVGAVLGILSKHAVFKMHIENSKCASCGLCAKNCPTGSIDFKNKTVDNETCIKCFRCLGACHKNGLHYGLAPSPAPAFNPNRRKLLTAGAIVAVFAVAAKSGLELSRKIASGIKNIILPAGAGNASDFADRCLNCNLCVENCPMKILKKANEDYPAVHIDYNGSFCDYNCNKCSQICPSGAIKRLSLEQKQKTQIALASINEDICVKCGLCVHKCPRQIIRKEDGEFPRIDAEQCIGCGACQRVCPVKAITVSAVETQKTL